MSHALATMRVADEPTKMKQVIDAKNPLLARRAKKNAAKA